MNSAHTTREKCHFEFFPSTRWRFYNNVTTMYHDWTGNRLQQTRTPRIWQIRTDT
jgi:hypothetical protein